MYKSVGRDYRAVIFDMDGVLVDTEPAFFDAANDVLAAEGASIEWERYRPFLGTSVERTWAGIVSELDLRGDLHDYLRRYGPALNERLALPRRPLTGVVELLDELSHRRVPYALATSSWRPWADIVLASAGLTDRFAVLVTAKDVRQAKPAPDIYQEATRQLAVDARHCVAVEDTLPGITAAKAAGMFAIQVRDSSTALPPIEQADLVIDALDCFPLGMLEGGDSGATSDHA
jgi:HAD superfamily hydrolase (TIGR01509 family)